MEDCVTLTEMVATAQMAGQQSFVTKPVQREHLGKTVPSLVSAETVAPVTRLAGSAAAHLESVETCARTAVRRDYMESTATRNVTVLITAAAIARMEPVCVIQGSTAGFVTYLVPSGLMDLAAHRSVIVCSRTRLNAIDIMDRVCASLAIRARPAAWSVIVDTMVQDVHQNASVQQECLAIT